MCSKERDANARFGVGVVVAVAANVVAFFDDEGGLTEFGGVVFGNDAAGEAGADYAIVVFFGEGIFFVGRGGCGGVGGLFWFRIVHFSNSNPLDYW